MRGTCHSLGNILGKIVPKWSDICRQKAPILAILPKMAKSAIKQAYFAKSKDDSRQQTGMFVNLARGTPSCKEKSLFIGLFHFLGTILGKNVPIMDFICKKLAFNLHHVASKK